MAHQGEKVFEIAFEIRTRVGNNIFILYQILECRTKCLLRDMNVFFWQKQMTVDFFWDSILNSGWKSNQSWCAVIFFPSKCYATPLTWKFKCNFKKFFYPIVDWSDFLYKNWNGKISICKCEMFLEISKSMQ